MAFADFEALRAVMPPPRSGGDVIDWPVLESELGVSFPSDYKKFVEAYGGGTIDETLYIIPLAGGADGWRQEYLNANEGIFSGDIEAELGIEIPGDDPPDGLLVPWAVAPSGAIGCWFVSGDDPDQWPVVIFRNRSHPTWLRYDGNFVDLLHAVITGELENPFGIVFPVWQGGADYLNRKDRELLKQRGISTLGYIHQPADLFSRLRAAGIDAEEYFPFAVRRSQE